MAWRVLGAVAAVLFGLFALLQYNDPDPLLWIGLFVGASATSMPLVRGRPTPRWAPLFIGVFAAELALMGQLYPSAFETQRFGITPLGTGTAVELMGCLLVVSWATVLSFARPFAEPDDDALIV